MSMQLPPNLSPWQAWSREVQERLNDQNRELDALRKQLRALADQVAQVDAKPTYNIERLEYHFDQLKVEKLEGTLNIGMTPPGENGAPGDIDQFSVPPPSAPNVFPAAESTIVTPGAPYPDIRAVLDSYFNNEAPLRLMALEQELGLELDPYHRRIVIEDLRRQIPPRINFYVTQLKDTVDDSQLPAAVAAKTIRDAEAAMRQYLERLTPNGNGNGNGIGKGNGFVNGNDNGDNGMKGGLTP